MVILMFDIIKEITDVFPLIEKVYFQNDLSEFQKYRYNELYEFHFSLGLWIRNNLLKESEKLFIYLKKSGVNCKDDMSELIINMFYITIKNRTVLDR